MNEVLHALRDAPHTSISAIKSYLICPMKHFHRYVLHSESTHRSVNLVLGSAVHEGIAAFYAYFAEHGEAPPVSDVLDAFDGSWTHSLECEPPVQSDDLGKDKDLGVELMKVFHETAPRPARVIAVEFSFAIPLRSPTNHERSHRLIVGAIDAVVADEAGRTLLLEAKTAKRRWADVQLRYDIQPTIYQIAAKEIGLDDDPTLRFDFLLKLKTPVFETTEVTRTSDDEVEALTVIWQVCRAVDAGVFYPVRSWACADCEFGHLCG